MLLISTALILYFSCKFDCSACRHSLLKSGGSLAVNLISPCTGHQITSWLISCIPTGRNYVVLGTHFAVWSVVYTISLAYQTAVPSMVIAERPRWQLNMATYSHYGNSQFQGQQWLPCMWVGHKIEVSAAALLATEITGDASMLKDKSAVARQDDIIISG